MDIITFLRHAFLIIIQLALHHEDIILRLRKKHHASGHRRPGTLGVLRGCVLENFGKLLSCADSSRLSLRKLKFDGLKFREQCMTLRKIF
jgi:hypothetical protein